MLAQHLTPHGFDLSFTVWSDRIGGVGPSGGRGWGLVYFDVRSRAFQIDQGYLYDDMLMLTHHTNQHFGAFARFWR